MLVFDELQKGTDPEADHRAAERRIRRSRARQFGILDLQGRSAGHSGLTNGYVSQDIQGQVPGTEIFYSIQGNILRPGEVVPNAVKAFLDDEGRDHRSRDGGDGSGRRDRAATAAAPVRRRRPTARSRRSPATARRRTSPTS